MKLPAVARRTGLQHQVVEGEPAGSIPVTLGEPARR